MLNCYARPEIRRSALLLALALFVAGPASATPILSNGSFEVGTDPGAFLALAPGATDLTSWEIIGAGVDYIGSHWQAGEGGRSLDLSGPGPGGVRQTFATIVGASYEVTFAMAGNPSGVQGVKELRVMAASASADYSFDTTGRSKTDMGWVTYTFNFVANSATTTLEFMALEPATGA